MKAYIVVEESVLPTVLHIRGVYLTRFEAKERKDKLIESAPVDTPSEFKVREVTIGEDLNENAVDLNELYG
jgi:hypothetical protein